MFKDIFVIFLLGHVLGDFYFQSEKMAQEKIKSIRWVFLHCIFYCIGMIVVMLVMDSAQGKIAAVIAAILHMIIDMAKYVYLLLKQKRRVVTQSLQRNIFVVDQICHIGCLVAVSYWLAVNDCQMMRKEMIYFFEVIGVEGDKLFAWCLALLMIHKPANIIIQKLLMQYKPQKVSTEIKKDNNAGRFIGTIERIIMLIFLAIEQYSAIGLVLTAKSIARYDRISKESDFAEYYLLGTLISTAIVIICSFII